MGARLGCDESWRRLVRLFAPLVYRWCWKSNVRGPEADNVVQEVFVTVFRSLGDFRRERPADSFRGWLWTLTNHKLADHWRAAKRRRRGLEELGGQGNRTDLQVLRGGPHGPEDRSCEAEVRSGESSAAASSAADPGNVGRLYQRAVELIQGEFESQTWQAFWQVVVEGRQAADVAADLGLTANAVYISKSRVLRRLRDELCEDE